MTRLSFAVWPSAMTAVRRGGGGGVAGGGGLRVGPTTVAAQRPSPEHAIRQGVWARDCMPTKIGGADEPTNARSDSGPLGQVFAQIRIEVVFVINYFPQSIRHFDEGSVHCLTFVRLIFFGTSPSLPIADGLSIQRSLIDR